MTKECGAEWDRLAGAALRARNALRVLLVQLDTAVHEGLKLADHAARMKAMVSKPDPAPAYQVYPLEILFSGCIR